MKKRILHIFSALILVFMLSSGVYDKLSSGAPVGSTGAPGENTCGKSGCHNGDQGAPNINTGSGQLMITHSIPNSGYVPDQIYDFTVSLSQNNINRFGYSFTALDVNDNKVGQLMVADSIRTQILQGNLQFTGKEYMTYRMVGTNSYSQYLGQWSFKWKAPLQEQGTINFYVAGISGNNDATDNGDLVYTYSTSVNAAVTGISQQEKNDIQFVFFPNPAKEYAEISLSGSSVEITTLSLFDLQGKTVKEFQTKDLTKQNGSLFISLAGLSKGEYFIRGEINGKIVTKKIIVE